MQIQLHKVVIILFIHFLEGKDAFYEFIPGVKGLNTHCSQRQGVKMWILLLLSQYVQGEAEKVSPFSLMTYILRQVADLYTKVYWHKRLK